MTASSDWSQMYGFWAYVVLVNCLFTITTKLNQIVSLFLLATVLQQKIVHSNIYIIVCCLYYTPQLQPADVYSIHCTVSI